MNEIVVVSGKGGTGKTSLTAAFAQLAGDTVVVADCDVDAADMHLLLEPDFAHGEDFYSGEAAVIDPAACLECGTCADVCRFDAIVVADGRHVVDERDCEGCGYCARVCPAAAARMLPRLVGRWYRSRVRTGCGMVHAQLGVGAENSGKLVTKVKDEARRLAAAAGRDLVLVDGSPGIGCPVVASLSGAALAVLVTEPTVSGVHDVKRVHGLAASFGVPCVAIINKSDLNPAVRDQLRGWLRDEDVPVAAELPYDEAFTRAIVNGRTIIDEDAGLADLAAGAWERVVAAVTAGADDRRGSAARKETTT